MRILFTRFPLESAYGGAEVQTLSLMKGLQERGHEVSFLGSCEILLKETTNYQLPTTNLNIGPPPVTKWLALSFLWRRNGMKEQLIETLKTQDSGLKILFMLSLSEKILLTDWAASQGTRVFWIEHDRVGPWLRFNPWLPALRRASQHATIVCVSELSARIYRELGFTNVVAIPNGIDFQRFSPRSRDSGVPTAEPSQLRVGSIARLSPEKGLDVLIQAVADLPTVHLTIVGKGREEGYLRNLIHEVEQKHPGQDGRFRILPHTGDLGSFYRSLDVFVLPSREHDPFGLVAAEAIGLGIATTVTDACGIASYLRNREHAIIASAESVSALRQAIQSLENREFRSSIGIRGREYVQSTFTIERMVDAYETLMTVAS